MSIARTTSTGISASEQRRYFGSLVLAAWVAAASLAVVALVVSITALRLYLAEQRAREALDEMRAKLTAPSQPRR